MVVPFPLNPWTGLCQGLGFMHNQSGRCDKSNTHAEVPVKPTKRNSLSSASKGIFSLHNYTTIQKSVKKNPTLSIPKMVGDSDTHRREETIEQNFQP